jgi:tripartite-type tricarboxylate transporter receptor subunit TctC
MVDFASMKPLLKEGKIRALAISGDKRSPEFPEVQTIKERFPEFEMYVWTALVLRSETPADVVARLSAAMQKALATRDSQEYIAKSGFNPNPTPPAQMMKYQEDEYLRYKRIADTAGIKPE